LIKVFVDTSYLLALVIKSDEKHEQAITLAQKYQNSKLITTQAIMLEFGNFLSRSYRDVAVDTIERFYSAKNSKVLNITPQLFEKGFNIYKTYQDKTWGLVDCISFVVMREEKIKEALSFDQHFSQADFQIAQ
jgi:uncharacterized protein